MYAHTSSTEDRTHLKIYIARHKQITIECDLNLWAVPLRESNTLNSFVLFDGTTFCLLCMHATTQVSLRDLRLYPVLFSRFQRMPRVWLTSQWMLYNVTPHIIHKCISDQKQSQSLQILREKNVCTWAIAAKPDNINIALFASLFCLSLFLLGLFWQFSFH